MNTVALEIKKTSKLTQVLFGLIVFWVAASLIPLSQQRYTTTDFGLTARIHELLNIENSGHLQSINTSIIGPYTSIKLKYFEHKNRKVSVSAYQILWFEPIINCISSNPDYICQ
jgi:hypothetical protein